MKNNQNNRPMFSIVMPNYNGAAFIKQAVNSVIDQSLADKEIIVVDDGSTDKSLNILKGFNDKICLFSQENKGSEQARNDGILKASGRYIVAVDSDDILLPYALDVYRAVINYFNDPPLIIANYQRFEHEDQINYNVWDGRKIKCVESPEFFKKKVPCPGMNPLFIIRKDVLIKAGMYHLGAFGYEDNQLLFRLGTESPLINILSPITVAYRIHDKNNSKNIPLTMRGALAFIDYERKYSYPGGHKKRFDRRGLIGTTMLSFIYHYILNNESLSVEKKVSLTMKVILKVRIMLFIGILRKIWSYSYSNQEHTIEF